MNAMEPITTSSTSTNGTSMSLNTGPQQRPSGSRMYSSSNTIPRVPSPFRMQRSPAADAAAAVFGLGVPSSSSKHIVSATTPPATTPPFHRTPSSWHRRHPTSHDWSRLRDAATAASTEAATPAFDRSLASVLGSPFLTTAVPLPSSSYTSAELLLDIVDGASVAVPRTETVTRPPSPAPTADYSMVSIPSMPSISATIFAARGRARDQDQHPERNRTPRPGVFSTPSRLNLAQYLASTTPSLSIPASSRKRSRAPSPAKAKGLIPRLFGSLSAPHKKGKHKAIPSFALDGDDDPDLAPLDGEEGELVDEACFFIDGDSPPSPTPEPEPEEEPVWIDPFSVLPPELALRVLGLLGVEDIVHCVRVCRAWRTLGLDNLLWGDLFAAKAPDGWKLDCTRTQGSGNGNGGANGKRRPAGLRERKPSERSIASTLARARKNSTRSLMSWRSGKGSTSAPDTLDTMDEETLGESPQLTPDWKKLYETRLALDKRWLHAEPEITKITGHTDSVYCLEFDSTRIITGSRDRTIKVWALATGELLGSFRGHAGSVLCLKFERDWDLPQAQAQAQAQSPANGADGSASALAAGSGPTPGFMVSGSSDCSILVWDLNVTKDGSVTADVRGVLQGHAGGVLDLRMDERSVVSCSKDALIQVWDRATLTLRCTLQGHEGPVNAVGLQGTRVVSASGDGKMILWDVDSGERLRTFEGHDRGLACIEFRGEWIVSGSNDCKIKVWDAKTGVCLRTLVGHTALVRALAFDPERGRLVSAGYDRTVKVWDLNSGAMVREFRGEHASHIFDVRFDVRRIVSTSHDQKVSIFDFGTGLDTTLFV